MPWPHTSTPLASWKRLTNAEHPTLSAVVRGLYSSRLQNRSVSPDEDVDRPYTLFRPLLLCNHHCPPERRYGGGDRAASGPASGVPAACATNRSGQATESRRLRNKNRRFSIYILPVSLPQVKHFERTKEGLRRDGRTPLNDSPLSRPVSGSAHGRVRRMSST